MEESNSTEKVIYSLVCVCLVLIGGVMSGLTLGLMSLDTVDLEVSCFAFQEVRLLHSLFFRQVLGRLWLCCALQHANLQTGCCRF